MLTISFYEIFTVAAGIAGNVFALVLFLSPLETFKKIHRSKSTEQFSGLPYIYSLLNCLVCMWYGLPFVSYGVTLVVTVNSIGALFHLAYVITFIIYADRSNKLKMSGLLLAVFLLFILIIFVTLDFFDLSSRHIFVGYLSVISLIMMFASPLSILNVVIKNRSVEYMPFYLSLATFLTSLSFSIYGVLLRDFFVYIPNSIGALLAVTQLILYAYLVRESEVEAGRPLLV